MQTILNNGKSFLEFAREHGRVKNGREAFKKYPAECEIDPKTWKIRLKKEFKE